MTLKRVPPGGLMGLASAPENMSANADWRAFRHAGGQAPGPPRGRLLDERVKRDAAQLTRERVEREARGGTQARQRRHVGEGRQHRLPGERVDEVRAVA